MYFRSKDTKKANLLASSDKIADTKSFGAPRTAYKSVVGPNKFNYEPKKACDPGPGYYGKELTSHPYKILGGEYVKKHKYSMRAKTNK